MPVRPTDAGPSCLKGQQNTTKPTWADLKAFKLPLHLIHHPATLEQQTHNLAGSSPALILLA